MRNLGQSDFDLHADYTNTKIVIISAIGTDLLERQYNVVMQPARLSPEQSTY